MQTDRAPRRVLLLNKNCSQTIPNSQQEARKQIKSKNEIQLRKQRKNELGYSSQKPAGGESREQFATKSDGDSSTKRCKQTRCNTRRDDLFLVLWLTPIILINFRIQVLFGRGGHANNHEGNRTYHATLETRAWEYSRLKGRNEKTKLAWEVVHQMKDEGTRFLHRDKDTGSFYEASDDDARKKVSQRLRELALDVREHEQSEEEEEEESELSDVTRPLPIDRNQSVGNPLPLDRNHPEGVAVLLDNAHLLGSLFGEEKEDRGTTRQDYQPEPLMSSSCDWSSHRAVVCGQLDDLSDCSFKTFVPYSFGVAFDLPPSMRLDFSGRAHSNNPNSSYVQEDILGKRKLSVSVPRRFSSDYQIGEWKAADTPSDFKIGRVKRRRTTYPSDSSSGDS